MNRVDEQAGDRRSFPGERSPGQIRVLVVDDHPLVREGLIAILGAEPDFEIAGEAASGETALELLLHIQVDVLVTDFRLPGMDAAALCRAIAEIGYGADIVVLSAFLDEDAVYAALMAGARAYVVKDVDAEELKRAIRVVARGETSVDSKVTGRIIGWAAKAERPSIGPQLRASELHVLQLLAHGKTTAQIAKEAGLRPATVKSYLSEMYFKLGVKTRAEAVAVAFRHGLLQSPQGSD